MDSLRKEVGLLTFPWTYERKKKRDKNELQKLPTSVYYGGFGASRLLNEGQQNYFLVTTNVIFFRKLREELWVLSSSEAYWNLGLKGRLLLLLIALLAVY